MIHGWRLVHAGPESARRSDRLHRPPRPTYARRPPIHHAAAGRRAPPEERTVRHLRRIWQAIRANFAVTWADGDGDDDEQLRQAW